MLIGSEQNQFLSLTDQIIENLLSVNLQGTHGRPYSAENAGSDVVIYRFLSYKNTKESFYYEKTNYITQAAISEFAEAAVHSHPFSKICLRNTDDRVLLLVKLQTDCSE